MTPPNFTKFDVSQAIRDTNTLFKAIAKRKARTLAHEHHAIITLLHKVHSAAPPENHP